MKHSVAFALAFVLAASGCETSKQLGSACKAGVCSQANAVALPDCLLSEQSGALPAPQGDLETATYLLCGTNQADPSELHCTADWILPTADDALPGVPTSCAERPFLSPEPDGSACRVADVAAPAQEDAGLAGDGFYVEASEGNCGPALHFTGAAVPIEGITASYRCSRARLIRDNALETIGDDQCRLSEASANATDAVGKACLPPAMPPGGFNGNEVYVETGSSRCDTKACVVYHLNGDASPDCAHSSDPRCASAAEVARRAFCSCRCDAPAGDPGTLCSCPSDYSCEPMLSDAPPGIRGSYCVAKSLAPRSASGMTSADAGD